MEEFNRGLFEHANLDKASANSSLDGEAYVSSTIHSIDIPIFERFDDV